MRSNPIIAVPVPRRAAAGLRFLGLGFTVSSLVVSLRAAADLPKTLFREDTTPRDWFDPRLGPTDLAPASVAVGPSRGELFFIDADVADPRAFWLAAPAGATVVCIPAGVDSWEFMAREAASFQGLAAIHVISHGDPGALLLNRRRYTAVDLESRAAMLRALGRALTKNGDILLYGCDTGSGAEGALLVTRLSDFTGADVAASANRTGGLPGDDWKLEISSGTIEAPVVAPTDYPHALHTASVTTIAQLKTAITAAVSDNLDDTITIGGNLAFASAADAITINVTDGHTLSIVGGGFTLDAAHFARALNVTGGSVAISNLTITKGLLSGTGGITAGAAPNTALGAGIMNAGTLLLNNVIVTANKAAGGGGGGGTATPNLGGCGAGGGGGGFALVGGGTGGNGRNTSNQVTGSYIGVAGSGGTGGRGGSYDGIHLCGFGGSTAGGVGGTGSGYSTGGSGGTASNGSISIGGGGGGSGYSAVGGTGGNAAGGIFNSGTLTLIGSSALSSNLGAGGGGGGGSVPNSGNYVNGGAGGRGVGALWNTGTVHITAAIFSSLTGAVTNAGVGGNGGLAPAASTGAAGGSASNFYNTGTLDNTYVANSAPTFVGATTTLAINQNAPAADIKGLLHVSDTDASQTETWSQSSAPSHGTLTITGATASSGSADITPGGTLAYTPTASYVGSDSFVIQVSDGTATATRTITVTVSDVTPPTIVSVVRLTPSGQSLTAGSSTVTFRVTYSEAVNGIAAARYAIETVNGGTVTGTIGTPSFVSAGVYDVTVTITGGSGEFRLKVVD